MADQPNSIFNDLPDYKKMHDDWNNSVHSQNNTKSAPYDPWQNTVVNTTKPTDNTSSKSMPLINNQGYLNDVPFIWQNYFIAFVLAVAFFLIVIITVFRLKRKSTGSNEPIDILKRRFANGEIDKDTFLQMKQEIKN